MSGYNLPPGVYESDIPGWNDVDLVWTQDCSHCDGPNEIEASVDPRYDNKVDWDCEHCGKTFVATYEPSHDEY